MEGNNWQSEEDSLISVETPLSQDTRLSLSGESHSFLPNDIEIQNGTGGNESSGKGINGSTSSTGDNTSTEHSWDFDFDELDKPWPATFERSISLLAGPQMDTDFVDKVTRSPKITPNLSKRRENVNYSTPESNRFATGKSNLIGPSKYQHEFKQEINKVKSLDFDGFNPNKRVIDAKMYRQKLIEEARRKQQMNKSDKPFFTTDAGSSSSKEKKKDPKPTKKKHDGHGPPMDEKASFGQCAFNMANILMGVGMLGLPYVFKSAGWIGGVFVTLTFSSVAWRTSILLGRELNGDPRPTYMFDDYEQKQLPSSSPQMKRMRKQISSFPDIARSAFGPLGNIFLSLTLYFELFSCLCIFFVTLGDHLHALFPKITAETHMIHVAFALAIPTALLRTPRLLSYLSAVGTFATICIVSAVVGFSMYSGDISMEIASERGEVVTTTHTMWETDGLVIAFGLIAFTFSGHAIIPSIYSSMSNPKEFESMISFTFVVVTLCCLLVAVSGYHMFGSLVDDQITLSLEKHTGSDNVMITTLTWLMILTAFSKFTLTAFPLALGIEEFFAPIVPSDYVMEWVSSGIKLVLIVSGLAVAIFIPSFSYLCSLVGLICTMFVSVIFPAAAHLKLFGSNLPLWEKLIDWIFIFAGTFMTVVGTIQSLG